MKTGNGKTRVGANRDLPRILTLTMKTETKDHWTIEQARSYFNKAADKGNEKAHKPAKKKTCPALFHMEIILIDQGLKFEKEHKFHPTRKWRFDFALVKEKIAIEYEGGVFHGKSRHTTGTGYTNDAEKYREAAKLGWRVLRYTAKGYSKLITDLKEMI